MTVSNLELNTCDSSSLSLHINAPRQYKILSLRYMIVHAKDNTFFTVPDTLEILENRLKEKTPA